MTDTTRLNDDWADLNSRVVLCWPEPDLARLRHLDDVLRAVRARPNAVLGALLRRAQAGDRLAGRVVVQALLPKLVRMAAGDPAAGVGHYVAQLWCVLMSYPIERRPRSVAAGLALDTLKAVVAERPRPVPGWRRAPGTDLDGPTVLERAVELDLLDEFTTRVLTLVYVDGLTSAAAGERVGLSAAAVRQRCSQAVRRLARHHVDLAAA